MDKETGGKTKLPWPVLGLLASILCSVIGLWAAKVQADSELRLQLLGIGKDVAELSRNMDRMQKQIESDRETRYTAQEAQRDLGDINRQLRDHEERLRRVEDKGRRY